MEYVLVIFMYAGLLSSGDSVAINNVPGFQSQELCEKAGQRTIKEFKNVGFKSGKFVCLKNK